MNEKPAELIHLEARVHQIVRDVLITADCENHLTLFARHSILEENDLRYLTSDKLKALGIWSIGEQNRILAAITKYVAPTNVEVFDAGPSAPLVGNSVTLDSDPKKLAQIENDFKVQPASQVIYHPPSNVDTSSPNITDGGCISTPKTKTNSIQKPTAPSHIEMYEEKECVVCLDNSPNIILIPCGHTCLCDVCVDQITECPLCRNEIIQKIKMNR